MCYPCRHCGKCELKKTPPFEHLPLCKHPKSETDAVCKNCGFRFPRKPGIKGKGRRSSAEPALRRSSAPVRRAYLLRRPTAALPNRACLLGAACLLRLSVLRLPQPRRQRQGHPALLARFRARLVVKPACRAVTWHGERAHNPFALPAPNASVTARHTCHPFRKKPPPADEPG